MTTKKNSKLLTRNVDMSNKNQQVNTTKRNINSSAKVDVSSSNIFLAEVREVMEEGAQVSKDLMLNLLEEFEQSKTPMNSARAPIDLILQVN